eukprot:s433_g12.t1
MCLAIETFRSDTRHLNVRREGSRNQGLRVDTSPFFPAAAIEIGTDHAQRCTAHRRMPGSSDHVLAAGHTVHLRQLALEALALL